MRFSCPRPLPLVTPDTGGDAHGTFTVTEAPLSPTPPEGAVFTTVGMAVKGQSIWGEISDLMRFRITRKGGVTIDFAPGANPLLVQHYLLGHVMGAILHLWGALPLHASCVTRDGATIAITGRRGAGKSTLAAALHQRGWTPVADDVTAISSSPGGVMLAWPGPPRFRLDPQAIKTLGLNAETGVPLPQLAKRLVIPTEVRWQPEPVRLSALILLTNGPVTRPHLTRIAGPQAVTAIHAGTFRLQLVRPLNRDLAHAQHCLLLARQAKVFALVRSNATEDLEALAIAAEHAAD